MAHEELDIDQICQQRVGRNLSGKWQLESLIGIGGMAAVYRATHRNGAIAAIKMLHPEYAAMQDVKERFLREAYIANKVDHPGSVRIFDDDVTEDNCLYIVMELLEGTPLDSYVKKAGGALPIAVTLKIAGRLLEVLEAAHKEGIVHRDIKPENIFLTNKGVLKLLDFGIARIKDAAGGGNMTRTGMLLGTPAFMAPEQALGRNKQVDSRTDLWAVGAIMFHLISGQNVHRGNTANELLIAAATEPPRSLARAAPKTPIQVVQLVDKALHFEPAQRFGSAAEMRAEIVKVLQSGLPQQAAAAPQGAQPQKAGAAPATQHVAPVAAPQPQAARPAKPQARPYTQHVAPVAAPQPQAARPAQPQAAQQQAARAAQQQTAQPQAAQQQAAQQQAARAAQQQAAQQQAAQQQAAQQQAARAAQQQAVPPQPARRIKPELASSALVSEELDLTAEEIALLQDIFRSVEKVLIARVQYGPTHPQVQQLTNNLGTSLRDALAARKDSLIWKVSPYGFTGGGALLWEPQEPYDRIPYQLFADGIRVIALLPGITTDEFQRFFDIITLDRAQEMSPEDDFVTLLWEAQFQKIDFEAIDTFAAGDQAKRAAFEKERDKIIAMAEMQTGALLEESWKEGKKTRVDQATVMAEKTQTLAKTLASGQSSDVEAVVRAVAFSDASTRNAAAGSMTGALVADARTKAQIAQKIDLPTSQMSDRFAYVAADSYVVYAREGHSNVVAEPLCNAVSGLAKENPLASVEMVRVLTEAIKVPDEEEAAQLRAKLTGELVSPELMRAILEKVAESGGESPNYDEFCKGLTQILLYVDATHLREVAKALNRIGPGPIFDVIVAYFKRVGTGNESVLGEMLTAAELGVAMAVIHALAEIGTPEAHKAIFQGTQNPEPLVRIEALGSIEGEKSQKVMEELKNLLQDKDIKVRLAALKAMADHRVRVAGPFLAMRVRAANYDRVPFEEKRQAFLTLETLASSRCEAICAKLLAETKIAPSAGHEELRAICADTLGRIGRTRESLSVLKDMAEKKWKNSSRVRMACRHALAAIEKRGPVAAGERPKGEAGDE